VPNPALRCRLLQGANCTCVQAHGLPGHNAATFPTTMVRGRRFESGRGPFRNSPLFSELRGERSVGGRWWTPGGSGQPTQPSGHKKSSGVRESVGSWSNASSARGRSGTQTCRRREDQHWPVAAPEPPGDRVDLLPTPERAHLGRPPPRVGNADLRRVRLEQSPVDGEDLPRYERTRVIVTSNKPFSAWAKSSATKSPPPR
jgi:hypothetical protein